MPGTLGPCSSGPGPGPVQPGGQLRWPLIMACSPQSLKQEQGLYLPSFSDCGLLAQCWFPRAPLPLLLTRPAAPGTGEVCPIIGYTDAEAPSYTCPTGTPGSCCLSHLRPRLLSAPQRTPGCPGEPKGPPDGETHNPRLRCCLSEAETLGPGTGTAQWPAQHHARLCSSLANSDTLCGSDSCSADALGSRLHLQGRDPVGP